MRKRRKPTELSFDLEGVRKLKRLTKRVWKGLEQIEKHMLKMTGGKGSLKQGKPSEEALKEHAHFLGLKRNFLELEDEEEEGL